MSDIQAYPVPMIRLKIINTADQNPIVFLFSSSDESEPWGTAPYWGTLRLLPRRDFDCSVLSAHAACSRWYWDFDIEFLCRVAYTDKKRKEGYVKLKRYGNWFCVAEEGTPFIRFAIVTFGNPTEGCFVDWVGSWKDNKNVFDVVMALEPWELAHWYNTDCTRIHIQFSDQFDTALISTDKWTCPSTQYW